MNKDQKWLIIIIAVISLLAIGLGIYAFKNKGSNSCKTDISDASKFKKEYEAFNGKKYDNSDIDYFTVNLDKDNLFKYVTEKKAVDILKNGTGIIYFGFPQCPWCRTLVPYLEDAARLNGLKEVYYLNILDIRDTYKVEDNKAVLNKKGTDEYYELLKVLDKYLNKYYIEDDSGKKYDTGVDRLYAPTIVVVKNGKIVSFHEGTVASQKKHVPLTKSEQKELENILNKTIAPISNTICSDTAC